ncbi:MAG TPA: hypothetical protein VLS28_11090 [Candidatus Sulfomarinibacteraceae bacterium]|nr:hypothetical protein [Candidatus Sulfomarinibacteraceae bacterium]
MPLSDRGRRILFVGFGLTGYALLARVLLVNGIQDAGGLGGIDAIAYWTAAGHALRGEPLYGIESFEFAAYQYPPPFAQVLAPASLLPMPVFVWLWRAVELVGLRLATGGWIRAGIAILVFPPVLAELDAGNVHLAMAGVTALAMRGIAAPVAPAALVKLAAWPLAPLAWLRDRRGLLLGVGVAAIVAIGSIVLATDAWREYFDFLASGTLPTGSYNVLVGVPVVPRLIAAAAFGLAAVRWIRLAPIAVLLAYPVVWFHGLSTLTAVVAPVSRSPRARPDLTASAGWPG